MRRAYSRLKARVGDPYPRLRRYARRAGYHLVRADFYSPIPDVDALPADLWDTPAAMPGVDLRLDEGVALLTELAPLIAEYAPPEHPPGTAHGYFRDNAMYGHLDGEVLYAMVRHLEPRRIVEVGAGFSTLVIADAKARNGGEVDHRVFDPFPSPLLAGLGGIELAALGAEEIPMETFTALESGDLLFIDTTHTVRPENDVMRLLLEVLPQVSPGVVVHIHDFFRPYEYPRFLMELGYYWQEHHLIQAFLAFNPAFEVLLAHHALVRQRRSDVDALVPGFPPNGPGSALWLRRVSD